MRLVKGNLRDICRIRLCEDYESKKLTDLRLNEKKNGHFVTILENDNGSTSHTVSINVGRILIFYCMEQKSRVLNKGNLSSYCGVN